MKMYVVDEPMKMIEHTPLAEVLAPGHHKSVFAHFGLDDAFMNRMTPVVEALTDHVIGLLDTFEQTGSMEGLCECHILKELFGLIDRHIKPQTMAEIACTTYIAGSTLSALHPYISRAIAGGAAPKQPGYFQATTTATA